MGKGDEPDDGEAVEGAAGAAGVVDKEVMVMLQFTSRRCFLSSQVRTKIYPLLCISFVSYIRIVFWTFLRHSQGNGFARIFDFQLPSSFENIFDLLDNFQEILAIKVKIVLMTKCDV